MKVICIKTPKTSDHGGPFPPLVEGKIYTVIDSVCSYGDLFYYLRGFEHAEGAYNSKLFRKLDDDFGAKVAEKIETQIKKIQYEPSV